MKYRTFGNTGLQVSVLGFGCMRLPVIDGDFTRIDEDKAKEMIRHAIDHGVNYFDTAYPYHAESFAFPGSSEPFLARALKDGYREKVFLATKLPCWLVKSSKEMDQYLDEQLGRLETGCIDFYLLHSLNRKTWDKLVSHDVIDFLDRARASGKIRYAGFSFHDDFNLFREIVDAYDWTLCQILYNYYDEHFQAGRAGLEYAAGKGLAVIAMEPLRGGSLVTGLPEDARRIMQEASPGRSEVDWAFRWLWNHPGLSLVLSGMSDLEQVMENLELAGNVSDAPWTDGDKNAIGRVSQVIKGLQKVNCTTCGYCMPCPEGVDIPLNFSLCNDHHMLRDKSAKKRYFGLLGESARASNCVECGQCEEKCPQQIPIMDELKYVAELFES